MLVACRRHLSRTQLPVWGVAREVVVVGLAGGVAVEWDAEWARPGWVVEVDWVGVGTSEQEARWVLGQQARLVEQDGVWVEREGGTWVWVTDQGDQARLGRQEGIHPVVEGLR